MQSRLIPANVFIGATGAGKTSAVRDLLAQRPAHERWALLVNDFGHATYAGAPGTEEGALAVREVSGCFCCTGRVALRSAVVSLLRESRPDRLLIEASAAAEPAAILRVLREPGIASAVALHPTFALAHAQQLADPRYLASDVYREQLEAADVIVLAGAAGEIERRAARVALAALISSKTPVVDRVELRALGSERNIG